MAEGSLGASGSQGQGGVYTHERDERWEGKGYHGSTRGLSRLSTVVTLWSNRLSPAPHTHALQRRIITVSSSFFLNNMSYTVADGSFQQQQRPTSLFFANKYNNNNNNNNHQAGQLLSVGNALPSLMVNDVFDEQEDQIVPDCSVDPKLDLSPVTEPWIHGQQHTGTGSDSSSSGFLTTAVHLSLQEVSYRSSLLSLPSFFLFIILIYLKERERGRENKMIQRPHPMCEHVSGGLVACVMSRFQVCTDIFQWNVMTQNLWQRRGGGEKAEGIYKHMSHFCTGSWPITSWNYDFKCVECNVRM